MCEKPGFGRVAEHAVLEPKLDGFGEVFGEDAFLVREIGDRASHTPHAFYAARRQTEPLDSGSEPSSRSWRGTGPKATRRSIRSTSGPTRRLR